MFSLNSDCLTDKKLVHVTCHLRMCLWAFWDRIIETEDLDCHTKLGMFILFQ